MDEDILQAGDADTAGGPAGGPEMIDELKLYRFKIDCSNAAIENLRRDLSVFLGREIGRQRRVVINPHYVPFGALCRICLN